MVCMSGLSSACLICSVRLCGQRSGDIPANIPSVDEVALDVDSTVTTSCVLQKHSDRSSSVEASQVFDMMRYSEQGYVPILRE